MSEEGYVVRIRGLPWQSTREEIVDFFDGCKIRNGVNGIFMTLSREGRPSGEAYVEMDSEEDFNISLDRNRKHMGSRYIEVFPSKRSEMEWIRRKLGGDTNDSHHHEEAFVRLRGLPFNCNKDDIIQFFSGMDLVMDGIVMPTDHTGRSTGEAYLQFASRDSAEKAMTKHKDKIGHRYIEIFKSSFQEFRAVRAYMDSKHDSSGSGSYGRNSYSPPSHGPSSASSYAYHKMRLSHPTRPAPYPDRFRGGPYGNSYGPPIIGASRGPPPPGSSRRVYDYDDIDFRGRSSSYGGRYSYDSPHPPPQSPISSYMGCHIVHMRGLPYKTSEGEIYEFFLPLRPLNVRILIDDMGRASGEADVEFATHEDALKAMNKDKAYIQKRYIELFLHSSNNSSNRMSSPHSFNDSIQRYGNSQINDNGNHRMAPMGGWNSSLINDDLIRSRVKLEFNS